MTKGLAFFDRLITFLIGLVLLLAGLLPAALYWDIPYVSDWLNQFDRSAIATVRDQSWYNTALIVTALLLFLLGLWFILANVRSRAFSNREITPADPAHGETIINVQRLSEAACATLSSEQAIAKADCRVAMVGQRPTATFTVTAQPEYQLEEAVQAIERANEDFRIANHTMEIDTVWKLHLDRVAA